MLGVAFLDLDFILKMSWLISLQLDDGDRFHLFWVLIKHLLYQLIKNNIINAAYLIELIVSHYCFPDGLQPPLKNITFAL